MKKLLTAAMPLAVVVLSGSLASAGNSSVQSVAYINPDTGSTTENPNVRKNSSCERPDRFDRQRRSIAGGSENNVHIDACLFNDQGSPADRTVTFANRGVGAISGCPDPDQSVAQLPQVMNGPKRAYLHDHNGDGRNDHCHQTGYQMKDAAGDEEYHIRVNNDAKAGRERVIFCLDEQQDADADASGQPTGHGCGDASRREKSRITIRWK